MTHSLYIDHNMVRKKGTDICIKSGLVFYVCFCHVKKE